MLSHLYGFMDRRSLLLDYNLRFANRNLVRWNYVCTVKDEKSVLECHSCGVKDKKFVLWTLENDGADTTCVLTSTRTWGVDKKATKCSLEFVLKSRVSDFKRWLYDNAIIQHLEHFQMLRSEDFPIDTRCGFDTCRAQKVLIVSLGQSH